MLIPRCCKGCTNRNQGTCNCVLPSYCNEYVEDDSLITDKIVYKSDIPIYPVITNNTEQIKGNELIEILQKQLKEKDHRIAVLEMALLDICKDVRVIVKTFWKSPSEIKRDYIKQAEKALEEKDVKD